MVNGGWGGGVREGGEEEMKVARGRREGKEREGRRGCKEKESEIERCARTDGD